MMKRQKGEKTAILILGWWFVQGKIIFHQKMEKTANTAPRSEYSTEIALARG